MNRLGPIVIVDDNPAYFELFNLALEDIKVSNKIVFFEDANKAFAFLMTSTVRPFLIFSDINMPKLDGIQLKGKIQVDGDIKLKSIPFIYFSASPGQKDLSVAYSQSAQGFFIKPHSYVELVNLIKIVTDYWQQCEPPILTC